MCIQQLYDDYDDDYSSVISSPFIFLSLHLFFFKFHTSVKSGESFRYLGRYFNFEMDDKGHKVELQSCLSNMLQRIDSFTILPSNKLLQYHRWVLSKLPWPLTVTNLSTAWVVENLDSVTTRFVRKWLELSISATLSGKFFLKANLA